MPLPTLCVLRAESLPSNILRVRVYFSADTNVTDATTAGNYSIPGLTVSAAAVVTTEYKSEPGTIVDLTVTSPVLDTLYSLQVSDVKTLDNSYTILAPDGLVTFKRGAAFIGEQQDQISGGKYEPRTRFGSSTSLELPKEEEVGGEGTGGGSSFNTGFN